MKILFIRHGETDWKALESRGVRGWARSFAPLTDIGRVQIDVIAKDYRLEEADAILCSSYARALESAARLSRHLNKPLYVEYDLHEWLPQKDPLGDLDGNVVRQANQEFTYYTGYIPFADRRMQGDGYNGPDRRIPVDEREVPPPDERTWESLDEVQERAIRALSRYKHFETVVVVTHAVLITSIMGVKRPIEHAEIVPFEIGFDADGQVSLENTSKEIQSDDKKKVV